jgi:hypothetical protein
LNTYRKTAVIVGVLFIIGTVFVFIGKAVYGPILDSAQYLERAYPDRGIVIIGILLEFMSILALPLIPVFAFSLLRKSNEPFAIGYVSMRLFESVLLTVALFKKASLIDISRGYLARSGADASFFQSMGDSIRSVGNWGGPSDVIYLAVFTAGAVLFYSVLYRSTLAPRSISVWGLVSAPLMTIGAIMSAVGAFVATPAMVPQLVFALPLAVQEMVLAVWLIAKGFNPSAVASLSAKAATN